MYGWIWRKLPGPRWVKVITAVAAVAVLVLLLFVWIFPWLSPFLPFQQQTVEG